MGIFDFFKKKKALKEDELDVAKESETVSEESVPDTSSEQQTETTLQSDTTQSVRFDEEELVVTIEEPAYIDADGVESAVEETYEVVPTTMTQYIEQAGVDISDNKQLLAICLGKMMVIQERYTLQIIQNRDWNIDLLQGKISFGEDEYPVQFIGSEANSTNTWLWGWHNVNQFAPERVALAENIKAIGETWQADTLRIAEHDLEGGLNGHDYAIIACGLSDGYCYQKAFHEKGAVFVAITDVDEAVFEPVDAVKFMSNTQKCIAHFEIDHKAFVESFLTWNQTAFEWQDHTLTAHFEQQVTIEFEELGELLRISNLSLQSTEE